MGLLDGGLLALQSGQQAFSNQYNTNRQREGLQIAREQQDISNDAAAVVARKDAARQNIGAVNAHFGQQGKQWNKTDAGRLLQERPDLINGMLNDAASERYRDFVNEDNIRVGAEVVKVIENDDGSYTPMVRRNDTGAIVPMTEGRSSENTPVVKLGRDQFNNVINSRYQAGIVDGGLENTGSYLATAKSLQNVQIKEEALALAVQQIQNVDELSQFYGVINDIDVDEDGATEALADILRSVGGDPEALQAAGEAKQAEEFAAQQEAAGEKPDAKTPLGRILSGGNTKQRQGPLGQNEKELMALYGLADRSDYAMVETIRDALDEKGVDWKGQVTGAFVEQDDESYEANSEAEAFYNDKKGVGAIAKALNRSPELLEEFNAIGPAAFLKKYQTTEEVEKLGGTETVKTVAFPDLDQSNMGMMKDKLVPPAPFKLSAENIKSAITNRTSDPSEEQKTAITTFLKSKGIDNDAKLKEAIANKEINREEGLMLAWVMGATAEGDTNIKTGIAQKITNLIDRDDQDVGTLEQAQLDSAVAQGRAAGVTAQAKYDEVQFKLREFDLERTDTMIVKGQETLDKVYKRLGLMDDEGNLTDAEFDGDEEDAKFIARTINGFIPTLKLAGGPVSAQAGMQFLNPMLSLYLQSQANADKASLFSGETYKDFWRYNPDGTTDFDLGNVRVAKVKNGEPVEIAYVDGKGVRSQAVPIRTILDDSPAVGRLLLVAAKANGQASDFKDADEGS